MALKLGELSTILTADDGPFQRGLRQARRKFDQHADQLKAGAAVAGAAIGVALAAGVAGAMDLDRARARLTAQVGDPVLARQLGEVAGRVYGRGFGESAAQSMDAARAVMSSGLLPKGADAAVIEEITVKAQTLATALGGDVTQAARAAGQMVRTGIAKNATEAFDILTRTMQVTGDQAGDLIETVTEYSIQFREVGIDGQKAMGMLAQAAQAGARDLDVAADAIKEFAIRSKDGSKASAEGFQAIGLNAEKMTAIFARGGPEADKAMKLVLDRLKAMKDPVEQDAAAVALFGTKAEDLQDALYAMDPTTAVDALGQVEGASKKAADALENSASQKLESFKRRAQAALVEKLAEALPTIEKVATWIEKNSGLVGGLAMGLGALALIVGTILGIYKIWIVLQTALNIVMMLNPIGLIILLIVGLIAVFVGLWIKFEGFRNFWKKTWEVIKDAALAVGRWFRDTLWEKWIKGAWNGILDAGKKTWNWLKSLPGKLKTGFSKVAEFITRPFRSAFNSIARLWNRTVGKLSFTFPGWVPGLAGKGWSAPQIPMLARGGHILRAGAAMVGEAGPEILELPAGATVRPLSGGGGGGAAAPGGGHAELRLSGEFRIRGDDLVYVIRERVDARGGNVQTVLSRSR